MQDLILARNLNYPEYWEFKMDDKSTHDRLIDDAKNFLAEHPRLTRYHFWCPEMGCCTIGALSSYQKGIIFYPFLFCCIINK